MPTTFPHATLPQHVPAIPALLPPLSIWLFVAPLAGGKLEDRCR